MNTLSTTTGVLLLSVLLLVYTQTGAYANNATQVMSIVTEKANQHGVPVALALGVTQTESNFRCSARGRAGERGAMQVKPATARSVGITGNLYDCATGIEAGVRYLKLALARAGGNHAVAASLYNKGIYGSTRVNAYGRKVVRAAGRFGKA